MLKAIALGFGLAIGIALGGAVAFSGLVYVGAHALDKAGRASLDRMQAQLAETAPEKSWQEYGDCRILNSAASCAILRPDARKEAAARGRDYAAYVQDVCEERLDVSMAACINEFFPN